MSARNKLRAFVLYSSADRVVPGVLVKRRNLPDPTNGTWVEVPANRCCSTPNSAIPTFFRTHDNVRAFIKYDKDGNVISSSTTLRAKNVPRVTGGAYWVEIPYRLCCVYTTTTTTTSSTTTTTTTLP